MKQYRCEFCQALVLPENMKAHERWHLVRFAYVLALRDRETVPEDEQDSIDKKLIKFLKKELKKLS